MPIIPLELSQRELEAITAYANLCNEPISQLIRKVLIREVTLADGYGVDDPQYEYHMSSIGTMRTQEYEILQQNYNNIRKILGWNEIKL